VGDIPHEALQQGGFVGPRFRGVFFFKNVFWRVVIPLVFGTCGIKPLDGLAVMPEETKRHLLSNPGTRDEYLLLWADCVDYDMGFQGASRRLDPTSFLNEMVHSVDRELQSTIADLCQQRPNSNAMYSAMNCAEKALKGFLCFHDNLTMEQAKSQFGHKLGKLVREIHRLHPASELGAMEQQLDAFAPYSARYTDRVFSRPELWRAYRVAQFAAAELMRSITGRNVRADVQKGIGAKAIRGAKA
jgi:hypothetical protein